MIRRGEPSLDVIIPTIGRASLRTLLDSLARAMPLAAPSPVSRIIVVDDRRDRSRPLALEGLPRRVAVRLTVIAGRAAGPAAARNLGWRASSAEWIAFLDDDVVVSEDWLDALRRDLAALPPAVAGSQGRVIVPLPTDRPPTDWERNVKGLERARWITADLAYRRNVLAQLGGFDERFPRAYREDADFGLRVIGAGYHIVSGKRAVRHPARPAQAWASVRLQAGNADDVLMCRLHGDDWYERAGARRGAFGRHRTTVAVTALALAALLLRRRGVALAGALWWFGATLEFAWRRIEPGPRTAREVITMLWTSAVIPFAATYHRFAGTMRHRNVRRIRRADLAGRPPGNTYVVITRSGG